MKGIDTNVLVRFLVRDDEKQAALAESWLGKHCSAESPGWIGIIVLCELSWVLARGYGYGRKEISRVLEQLTRTVEFDLEDRDLVRTAIRRYKNGPADFPDFLIAARNRDRGAASTVTFDKRAAKLPEFSLLK